MLSWLSCYFCTLIWARSSHKSAQARPREALNSVEGNVLTSPGVDDALKVDTSVRHRLY